MKPVIDILEEKVALAMVAAAGVEGSPAVVKPSADARFGDYQANGVMGLAKKLKTNPRKLAEEVVGKLDVSDICESVEIAGPGFINFRLRPEYLAERLLEIYADEERLGVEKAGKVKTVVVDFSGPNIAKQMHVGHLRSTIIGDCICRMLEFEGHKVIRQNHIGDWGLQMGMIINTLIEQEWGEGAFGFTQDNSRTDILRNLIRHSNDYPEFKQSFETQLGRQLQLNLENLERAYKRESEKIKSDDKAAKNARERTCDLQQGDHLARYFWEEARQITLDACFDIYDILDTPFSEDDIRGESFYADKLAGVVEDLKAGGLAKESDGAMCVFPDGFTNKEGDPLPFIVQKSDGAFLYATTDLAAMRYRVDTLKADEIIYVTDARQKLHFDMMFAVSRMAGWARDDTKLVHVMFGTMMGTDGKPFKTRSGENVKLKELLEEAVERARSVVETKNPDLSDDEKANIAKAVGIGAVKYADFSNNRTTDYMFSFDKMLAMEGNTAPYMQYAYARVKSIKRKAGEKGIDYAGELSGIKAVNLSDDAELDLAKHLVRYGEAIEVAVKDCKPNYLTSYLYDLAQKFSSFYNACPVLITEADKRPTRVLLCELTAKIIAHGLSELLGIEVVEQM